MNTPTIPREELKKKLEAKLALEESCAEHVQGKYDAMEHRTNAELLRACLSELERVKQLEDLLFNMGMMDTPPCFCCGYNGAGYYQPDKHPCAARHRDAITTNQQEAE